MPLTFVNSVDRGSERRGRIARQTSRAGRPEFHRLSSKTGCLLWSDKSPRLNILHGQWSSPATYRRCRCPRWTADVDAASEAESLSADVCRAAIV